MRIVVDTNVLIASLISHGFTSKFILNEVKEKLTDKFKHSPETADEAVVLFASRKS